MLDIVFDPKKTQLFYNFSATTFPDELHPCTWDSEPCPFVEPGQTIELPQYLAYHMAKHLADREIIYGAKIENKDPLTNGPLKEQYMQKALVGEIPVVEKPKEVIKEEPMKEAKEIKETKKPKAKKKEDINPDFEN